jgi:transcriptional regulator of heat shock response
LFIHDYPKQREFKNIKNQHTSNKNSNLTAKCLVLQKEALEDIYPTTLKNTFPNKRKLQPDDSNYKQELAEHVGLNITQEEFEKIQVLTNFGDDAQKSGSLHDLIFTPSQN